MDLELWLLVREAQNKELIEVEFDCESKGKQFAVFKALKNVIFEDRPDSKRQDEDWNIFRQDVIEKMFEELIKPKFEEEIIKELTESA